MTRKSVIFAAAVACCIVFAADLAARRLAANSVPRQLIRTIVSSPYRIDILGMGNSLIAAGFDSAAIEKDCESAGRHCTAVNGALGATGVIEHLALTRLALRGHSVGALVYGFFDEQMANDVAAANSDLFGNRNVLYYLEPEQTLRYAHFNPLDRLLFRAYSSSALLSERGAIWAKVEKLRRSIASVGMPADETNRFGRAADFALLEANDINAFERSCKKVIRLNRFLAEPAEALLREARKKGTRVLVVEMPGHPRHLKEFYSQPVWSEYRSGTRRAVETEGASYLNASDWIPDERMFSDHLHLSPEGARIFSRQLTEYLLSNSL